MSSGAKRQRRLRQAQASKGWSGGGSAPKELREAWSIRKPNDPTIANYCADPLSDAEPEHGSTT